MAHPRDSRASGSSEAASWTTSSRHAPMSAQEPARRDKRDGPPLSERQAQRERLRGVDRSKAMLSPVLCPRASGPPDAANVSIGHMLVPCDPKEVHPEHNGAWFCDTCQPGFQGKSPSDMMHRCQFGCAFAMCEGCAADRCFQDGDRVLFSGDSDVSGWDSDGLGGGLMTLSVGATGVCLNGVPVDALALQELSKVIEPPRHKLRGAANGSQDGWEAELQARVEALQAQTARLEADKITMMQQGAEAVETLRQSKARAAPRPHRPALPQRRFPAPNGLSLVDIPRRARPRGSRSCRQKTRGCEGSWSGGPQSSIRMGPFSHPDPDPLPCARCHGEQEERARQAAELAVLKGEGLEGLTLQQLNGRAQQVEEASHMALGRIHEKQEALRQLTADCIICCSAPRQVAFVPCGHHSCCASCVASMVTRRCPICRAEFEATLRIVSE